MCSSGKRCTIVASLCIHGISRCVLAVDCIVDPFGSSISIGSNVLDDIWLANGTSLLLKKCPVLPVSAIVWMKVVEGGPSGMEVIVEVLVGVKLFFICLV